MSKLSQKEIRDNAVSFVHEWKDETSESAESQTFWNEFFDIFGVTRRKVAVFEKSVPKIKGTTGAIDLFWKGVLLVEHKSRGQSLDKASVQAFDYMQTVKDEERPRFVIVSDFANFTLYDLEKDKEHKFTIEELPDKTHLFGFISGWEKRVYKDQDPVNIKVAEKMGELHDELLGNGYTGHDLEVFLVRIVYCLFADNTHIFPKDSFLFFLEEQTDENGANVGAMLSLLFQVLNTPQDERQTNIGEELAQLPYVNGKLFEESIKIPHFNRKMRETLIEACRFDWGKVSPAIFGSLFQSVMDAEERRNLGAHYTSEQNILKLVQGLFLDELYTEFEKVKNNRKDLNEFHERIGEMRFFDPACGCGNFLVITYREMRLLELEVLKQKRKLEGREGQNVFFSVFSYMDVDAFYGIEVEEFPAQIASIALWITDHLMNNLYSTEFGQAFNRLPLKKSPQIVHGNALRLDWSEIVNAEGDELVILGNPPFVGKDKRSKEQTADMEFACSDVPKFKTLDYVCAWYIKAAKFIENTKIKVGFVSTNSITQGEQVGILWEWLLQKQAKIHFAHRTFKWNNEARGKAAVHCVIIGFGLLDIKRKRLFDYETPTSEPHEIICKNINPYLIDYDDLIIPTRREPISDIPNLIYGNKPVDGGNLFINSREELNEFLDKEPKAEKFIRRIYGSQEFINGKERYCIWLKDAIPSEWRNLTEVKNRVQAVRDFRSKSKKQATVKLADVPYLFAEIRQPENDFLIIPLVSSENRVYIPIGFFPKEICVNNLVSIVPDATLYLFGVLTSAMHMAWMRQVCGRLESRYRYSNNLVYNNYPFPKNPSNKQKERVEKTAQAILDARLKFPEASLADLYDPLAMPKELLDAHRANDKAVETCYSTRNFTTDLQRLEFLFKLYRQYTDPLAKLAEKEERKAKRLGKKDK